MITLKRTIDLESNEMMLMASCWCLKSTHHLKSQGKARKDEIYYQAPKENMIKENKSKLAQAIIDLKLRGKREEIE